MHILWLVYAKEHCNLVKSNLAHPLTVSSPLTAGVSTIMDKNAEVLVCGASIMKDVWEIRLREYRQKRQLEEERIRKSALERWGPAEPLVFLHLSIRKTPTRYLQNNFVAKKCPKVYLRHFQFAKSSPGKKKKKNTLINFKKNILKCF